MSTRTPLTKVVVLIPTYNERESLPLVVEKVRRLSPELDILVLEDNSPDGTGAVADELSAADPQVFVMHRQGKEGLGKAYLAGFRWAEEHGYDAVIEMDADGSHRAEHLPAMLAAGADADVVIGSRWVKGGKVENWPIQRILLSRLGNLYIRAALGMPVGDATAGFRLYRVSTFDRLGLDHVESAGFSFQADLTRRAVKAGLKIVEVPITFVERELGESKMDPNIMTEELKLVTRWGIADRSEQVHAILKQLRGRRSSGS